MKIFIILMLKIQLFFAYITFDGNLNSDILQRHPLFGYIGTQISELTLESKSILSIEPNTFNDYTTTLCHLNLASNQIVSIQSDTLSKLININSKFYVLFLNLKN